MAQPSNANRLTRNINARIARARFLELKSLLADRGTNVNEFMNEVVDAYLRGARGYTEECACARCISGKRGRAHFEQGSLFDVA